MSDERDEPADPAEERLGALLLGLRADAPAADAALTQRVMASARWQQPARGALRITGLLVAGVAEVLELLLGIKRTEKDR